MWVITSDNKVEQRFRWVEGSEKTLASLPARAKAILTRDTQDHMVVIFATPFMLKYYSDKYPDVNFKEIG